MYKKVPTEKAPIKRNDEKINFYIDMIIKEINDLEKYKCDEFSSKDEFKKIMGKSSSLEKIISIIHNVAYEEWINK